MACTGDLWLLVVVWSSGKYAGHLTDRSFFYVLILPSLKLYLTLSKREISHNKIQIYIPLLFSLEFDVSQIFAMYLWHKVKKQVKTYFLYGIK